MRDVPPPVHLAPSAITLVRSWIPRRRRWISESSFGDSIFMSASRDRPCDARPALTWAHAKDRVAAPAMVRDPLRPLVRSICQPCEGDKNRLSPSGLKPGGCDGMNRAPTRGSRQDDEALTRRWTGLPPLEGRKPSVAFPNTAATPLGRAASSLAAAHPGVSGIHPLRDAREAFAARALLADAAERSLDVQYYIWRKDLTGTLLFDCLREAADRGVRVRLLLDDNNTSRLDATLAALDSHPNIEVRLFNPFVLRKARALGYATDFSRLNRRMDNKSFTADNQATIVGGRNVGDEYFGATHGVLFADLDVLALGPVVSEVSAAFDRYWASASSYPVERLLPPAPPARIEEVAAEARRIESSPEAASYVGALRETSLFPDLARGTLEFDWAAARIVCDDPIKGLGRAAPESLVYHQFKEVFGEPGSGVDLVSPYFVPTAAGVEWFAELARRGVEVRILTNS